MQKFMSIQVVKTYIVAQIKPSRGNPHLLISSSLLFLYTLYLTEKIQYFALTVYVIENKQLFSPARSFEN